MNGVNFSQAETISTHTFISTHTPLARRDVHEELSDISDQYFYSHASREA